MNELLELKSVILMISDSGADFFAAAAYAQLWKEYRANSNVSLSFSVGLIKM